jgi:hypothetical protein
MLAAIEDGHCFGYITPGDKKGIEGIKYNMGRKS